MFQEEEGNQQKMRLDAGWEEGEPLKVHVPKIYLTYGGNPQVVGTRMQENKN